MIYADRRDAGKQLADRLQVFRGPSTIVLALPRGGVAVGVEIAKALDAPLGVMLVRKIGYPMNPEYAIGAIAEGEAPIYTRDEAMRLSKQWLENAEVAARDLMKRRRDRYFGGNIKQPEIKNKTVIVVDDGIATGLTMEAAVRAIKNKQPKWVIVAVPVASAESISSLVQIADEVIVLDDTNNFSGAVGSHYRQFNQVDDEEVVKLLQEVQNDTQTT